MALHLNPPPVLLLVTELRPSGDKTGSHGRISGFGGAGDRVVVVVVVVVVHGGEIYRLHASRGHRKLSQYYTLLEDPAPGGVDIQCASGIFSLSLPRP